MDAARIDEPHGRPLVPAGEVDEFRVDLHGAFELFPETEPFAGAPVLFVRLRAVMIAASHLFHVVRNDRVRRGRYRDHLGFVGTVVPAVFLRIDIRPRAFVVSVAEPVPCRAEPRMTHGEKAGHVRRDSFRRTEDQRLAFPAEPQLFVQIFTVEAVEQVFQRFLGVGVEDKRDLFPSLRILV